MATEKPLIYGKLGEVQRDIDAIPKSRKNDGQGFMFRGVQDVYNALHPILAKHGIITTSEIVNAFREERTTKNGGLLLYSILDIKFTFYAEDGSNVSTQARGEGMDSSDKASNKAMAVAHKYALTQTFTIPYEEMPDPDKNSHEVKDKLTAAVDDGISKLSTVENAEDMRDILNLLSAEVKKDKRFRDAAGAHMKAKDIELPKPVTNGSK